jgi:hypothetical protein
MTTLLEEITPMMLLHEHSIFNVMDIDNIYSNIYTLSIKSYIANDSIY